MPRASRKNDLSHLRTWVEIDARAAKKNFAVFRKLVGPNVKLWSVVKSNAYGHGLFTFSSVMDGLGVDGFCVDSVVEGLALRRTGIKRPILVLGQTLAPRYAEAAKASITISISNFEALRALIDAKRVPNFHVKIDTGMHRQGFYPEDVPKVIALIKKMTHKKISPHLKGVFTHFAAAKDINYPTFTKRQFKNFQKAVALFEQAGFIHLVKHAAATGGTLIDPKYHLDAVRVGVGLYGHWPSKELEIQLGNGGRAALALHPVLRWRAVIGEVKRVEKGSYIGYNLTERLARAATIAIIPVGYWHGFPWALSGAGEVIIRGQRVRVLGRVSMDMIAVGPVPATTRPGDIVTLVGNGLTAESQAAKAGSMNYELLTRLNPLMERVIIR